MASANRKALMRRLVSAQESGVGNNFKDGRYRLAISSTSLLDGFKGSRFQAEFVPMQSIKIPVVSEKTGEKLDITPNPVGSKVDWLQMLDDKDSPGPGNVRRLLAELENKKGINDEEYAELLQAACDVDEDGEPVKTPAYVTRGMVIDMETLRIITAKNKKEIVVQKWTYVEQSDEEKAAVIEWLGKLSSMGAAEETEETTEAQA